MHQIEKKALNPGADSGGCAPGTLRPPPPTHINSWGRDFNNKRISIHKRCASQYKPHGLVPVNIQANSMHVMETSP